MFLPLRGHCPNFLSLILFIKNKFIMKEIFKEISQVIFIKDNPEIQCNY